MVRLQQIGAQFGRLLALTMFVSQAGVAHAAELALTASPPDGFVELEGPRDVMVDVYFGGNHLGLARATALPGALRFQEPDKVALLLAPYSDSPQVKQALLALLEQGPKYGYQLRTEFEERTGATWPLNVGQVYTTLARLERDGLVQQVDGAGSDAADTGGPGPDGHVVYRVTDLGRAEVLAWFTTPVPRTQPPRDELAIKLALAVTVPGVDVGTVIQQQRSATMSALQDYTRLKRTGPDAAPQDASSLACSGAM